MSGGPIKLCLLPPEGSGPVKRSTGLDSYRFASEARELVDWLLADNQARPVWRVWILDALVSPEYVLYVVRGTKALKQTRYSTEQLCYHSSIS